MDEKTLVNHCPLKSIDCLSSQHRSHLSLIRMNRHLLCQWKRSTNGAIDKSSYPIDVSSKREGLFQIEAEKNTECSNLNEWTIMGGINNLPFS